MKILQYNRIDVSEGIDINKTKIRQILLHWGYELTEKDFFVSLTN